MKAVLFTIVLAAGTACALQSTWGQCGGKRYTGETNCVSGAECTTFNSWYAQCVPYTATWSSVTAPETPSVDPTSTWSSKPVSSTAKPISIILITSTVFVTPSSSIAKTTSAVHITSTNVVTTSSTGILAATSSSSKAAVSSSSATTYSSVAAASSSALSSSSSGVVTYAGVNIAGFDFGCGTDGTCTVPSVYPPGSAGIGQMDHFVKDDGLNAFRLPVGWQYLVSNNLGGTLDATNFATYDSLVQGCLNSGAEFCLIDIHNYARWNGNIIGQGRPTNAQFASLWSQIATKYKDNPKVAFGIMNEPHDIPDIDTWAETVQAAVTAIRQAGATSQMILLPGNDYTSASGFVSNGSGAALMNVTNTDGSTTNLIFDVHKYLDSDGSGTSSSCATNNVATFQSLGEWLRQNSRKAFLSETGGGGDDSSCLTNVCQELAELNTYSDVFLGWTAWAAGSFATSYALSQTPTISGTTYTDQPLLKQCIAGMFKKQTS